MIQFQEFLSQMLLIRYWETIQVPILKNVNTDKLIVIPLFIEEWIRYLLGIDNNDKNFEL